MKEVFLSLFALLLFVIIGSVSCDDSGREGKAIDEAPADRFVDNGDGTVTDNMTGLMWEKKVAGSGCLHCVHDTYYWKAAMSEWISEVNGYTDDDTGRSQSGLGGHTDWRLPTLAELLTIEDCNFSPCIHPIFGPTQFSWYLSSTTLASHPSSVWFADFVYSGAFNFGKDIDPWPVRAVRRSQ
jgi:hypothetical protein